MSGTEHPFVEVDPGSPIWDRCFVVAPLILVGTREPDGRWDIAPKHLAAPMSWEDHFGFVCCGTHATYQNIARERAFTVSFPRPDQVVLSSLAASPRGDDDMKTDLASLPLSPARAVEGVVLDGAYLQLECELDRIVDGLGANVLVIGRVVAARVAEDSLRGPDRDDKQLLAAAPVLAYLHPRRYAVLEETHSFPFPDGFRR